MPSDLGGFTMFPRTSPQVFNVPFVWKGVAPRLGAGDLGCFDVLVLEGVFSLGRAKLEHQGREYYSSHAAS